MTTTHASDLLDPLTIQSIWSEQDEILLWASELSGLVDDATAEHIDLLELIANDLVAVALAVPHNSQAFPRLKRAACYILLKLQSVCDNAGLSVAIRP
jgi:hypothetical protein